MKIALKEKVGYGLGDLGCNVIFQTVMAYLMFYYTDIALINAATVGVIFLMTRIIDAISDPVMGFIIDKTNTRYGRFRPYLLFGSVFLGLTAFACFTIPVDYSENGKIAYAAITYIVLSIAYTVVNIPYSALTSAISADPDERTKITAIRVMFAVLSGLVVAQIGNLVDFFGEGDKLLGYRYAIGFAAFLSTALLWITFATTKERCIADSKSETSYTLKDCVRLLSNNRPLIILSIVFLMTMTAGFISFSMNIYFLEHVMKRPDLIGTSIMVGTITTFLGTFFVPIVTKMYGKKETAIVILAAFGVAHLFFAWNSYSVNSVEFYFVIVAAKGLLNAFAWSMGWAMLPDTIEYGEKQTGIRSEGLVYSAFSFCQKLGMALSGVITGFVLTQYGYDPESGITTAAMDGIILLFSYIPFVLAVCGSLLLNKFNLSTDVPVHRQGLDVHKSTDMW
ncbi:MFS transporter [Aeromonas finlandensis]|uniref:MFS transporter n=1 Tax=Aeromonas finlandensis TaxID=1543375 RepID=UPI00067DF643|nr:MFS transporter [Aeromonas finlandensis]